MTTTHELEERLQAMFAAQAEAIDAPDRHWSELSRSPTPARSLRRPFTLAVAALAGVVAVLGLAVFVRAGGPEQTVETNGYAGGGAAPATAGGFRAETKQVALSARSLSIEVEGRTFSPNDSMTVSSDPGSNDYTTLELEWHEHGVLMRWYIYFRSDGREWWSEEMRTYDGRAQGEWITYKGDFFRRPLGTPFVGDLDAQASDHGVTSRLRVPGLRLEAFRKPAA